MTLLKADNRFFDVHLEPLHSLPPINDYDDMPLLSLKMAVENLDSVLPKASQNAHIAAQKCEQPGHGLTRDQSAALFFYTMNWKSSNQAISTQLNAALRSDDRTQIIPYFFYIKLIISALDKLKSVKKTVWRGVKADVSNDYPRGKIIIWQGFSSCVSSMDEIESDRFVGRTGTRTVFQIECETGKAIKAHSQYHDIDEVVLLPATHLRVFDQVHRGDGLCIIRLKEITPCHALSQSEASSTTRTLLLKERTENKIGSAPVSPSMRSITNAVNTRRSHSLHSLASSSLSNTTDTQIKTTKPCRNKPLKELLRQEQTNQTIRLTKQFFNYDDIDIIAHELTTNTSWTMMYLWENHMNERHMRILMDGLTLNSTLVCLSLDRNMLGDDGASVISAALRGNTSLRSIYLNSNNIGDQGAQELSQMLHSNQHLIHLQLSCNSIGDNGVVALSDALKVNRSLRTLCLNENKITHIGAKHLAEMLKVNTSLVDLRLSSNAIGDEGVMLIVDALEKNNTLESLHIGQTMMSCTSMHQMKLMLAKNRMLKCLCMEKNDIGDIGMMLLIEALRENRTLTTIDISMTDLTKRSAKKLACLLGENRTAVRAVNMSDNEIGDEGVGSIADALKRNRSLVKLVIENVGMTVKGIGEIAAMLNSNESVECLVLNNNVIDEDGLKLLVEGLEQNKIVKHVFMNSCDMNDQCIPLIIQMMKQNETLASVELVKNNLTEHGKMVLNEASVCNKACSLFLDFTFH